MSDGLIPNSFTLHSGTSHPQRSRRRGERETEQEKRWGNKSQNY